MLANFDPIEHFGEEPIRQAFRTPLHQIRPHLFLGCYLAASNVDILRAHNIGFIVNCLGRDAELENAADRACFTYYTIEDLEDVCDAEISQHFERVHAFIQDAASGKSPLPPPLPPPQPAAGRSDPLPPQSAAAAVVSLRDSELGILVQDAASGRSPPPADPPLPLLPVVSLQHSELVIQDPPADPPLPLQPAAAAVISLQHSEPVIQDAASGSRSPPPAEARRGVLVHCAAGVSRSATLVVAHLMQVEGGEKSALEVLREVQEQRKIVNPNTGFRMQLLELEERLKKEMKKKKTSRK